MLLKMKKLEEKNLIGFHDVVVFFIIQDVTTTIAGTCI